MVKIEPPSSSQASSSESDSDVPSTPLAASTQKSYLPMHKHSDDERSNESEDYQPPSQSSVVAPKVIQETMEKYLTKFPFVRPSKAKYNVDVDITDSDDEVWIVKCPASIDAKEVLTGAKLGSCSFGEASKIQSSQADSQLEAFLQKNTAQKPVAIMSGTEFKSFVPVGTIQIRESIDVEKIPSNLIKQESRKSKAPANDEVPYPDILKDRHPLLGANFKSALKLPKRVKKTLSMAQQRVQTCYLKTSAQIDDAFPESRETKPKASKRKHMDIDLSVDSTTDDMIQTLIKEEVQTPPRKKVKVEKKEPLEDDLSWLHNI